MSGSSTGNSALGSSGSTTGTTGSMGGASSQSSDMSSSGGDQSQGGIKGAMANMSPDKVHQKIDQVAQGAQPLVDRLVSTAHAGVDRLTGMLSGASESLGQRKGQLGETYQTYSTKSTEYVKTNPGTALLVAAGVGFLLAKLLGSSNTTERKEYRYYRD